MSLTTVDVFLRDSGVPKIVLKENERLLQKLQSNNIKLMVFNIGEFLWVIENKFVLLTINIMI